MSQYPNIISRLYNTPLCISEDKLTTITSVIGKRLILGETVEIDSNISSTPERDIETKQKVEVIGIYDSLVAKNGAGFSGYTSYDYIQALIESKISKGATTIVLDIHSPGGEVFSLFALVDYIYNLRNRDIKVIAFTDGYAASAAYAIFSAAEFTYMTESSFVGSIGAIASLVDISKAQEQKGIKEHIIRSKSLKAITANAEISPDIIENVTEKVMLMDEMFNNKVIRNIKGMSLDTIMETKGDIVIGTRAIELSLVQNIVSNIDDVIEIANSSNKPTQVKGNIMTQETDTKIYTQEDMDKVKADALKAEEKAVTDERLRCTTIIDSAITLGISSEKAKDKIEAGRSATDTVELFTELAELRTKSTSGLTETALQSSVVDKETESVLHSGAKFNPNAVVEAAKNL